MLRYRFPSRSIVPLITLSLMLVVGCHSSPIGDAAKERSAEAAFSEPPPWGIVDASSFDYRNDLKAIFDNVDIKAWDALGLEVMEVSDRFPDGWTRAEIYFGALESAQKNWDRKDPTEFLRILERWERSNPDSPVHRIAGVQTHLAHAWDSHNAKNKKELGKHLEKTAQAVEACLRAGITHPQLYALRLEFARLNGSPRRETERLFLEAVEVDPWYIPLYREMAEYLVPRWHGRRTDVREFMKQAGAFTRAQGGDAMGYAVAQAMWRRYRFEGTRQLRLRWAHVKQAHEDFARVFPDAIFHDNLAASWACSAGDKDYALSLFEQIGDTWYRAVWPQTAFEAWRAWARHDGPEPQYTALHTAAREGDTVRVRRELERGAAVDSISPTGSTPVALAVTHGHYDAARVLLEAGADAAGLTWETRPILYSAVYSDNAPMAELLLEHGADIHAVYNREYRVFHVPVRFGFHELVALLLEEYGADPNLRDDLGSQPMHFAAGTGDVRMLEVLLEHGADIDSPNNYGTTPLLRALDAQHCEAALFLLTQGADPNVPSFRGWAPLTSAVDNNLASCVEALLEHGADVRYQDATGWTAMHMAAMNGATDLLALLLGQPTVDINTANNDGRTLAHQAAQSGRTETLKLLVERGADFNRRNNAGNTPLDVALQKERMQAVEYLRSLGAEAGRRAAGH
jgi:uncharacterized protein